MKFDFSHIKHLLGKLNAWPNSGSAYAQMQKELRQAPEPTTAQGWLDQSIQYSSLHQASESHRCLMRALELEPDNREANLDAGIECASDGQYQDYAKALEYLQRYRQAGPTELGNMLATGAMADALMGLGHIDEALREYRLATELGPEYPGAWSILGGALAKVGQYDEAVAAYQKAISVKPSADYQIALGHVFVNLGRIDEAVQAWQDVATEEASWNAANRQIALGLIREYRPSR